MSAAVVLALASRGGRFSYVDGVKRNKQVPGVVIDGREPMLDLLAKAVRRAEVEFKHDDAVVRL